MLKSVNILLVSLILILVGVLGAHALQKPSVEGMLRSLIIVGFEGSDINDSGVQLAAQALREKRIGGLLVLGRNVSDEPKTKEMLGFLQNARTFTALPNLIAIDQEGGKVQRLKQPQGWEVLPSAHEVAVTLTVEEAEGLYRQEACSLRDWGVTYNLGPVGDLATNPDNPIIAKLGRSFDSDPQRAIEYTTAFIKAHQECAVLTAIKHYPGHGSSQVDTHKGFADITDSWNVKELEPFVDPYLNVYNSSIMTGHVSMKLMDPNFPASLSLRMINGLLRGKYNYNGIVISDDLTMRAISDNFGQTEAAVLAFKAGTDILLYSLRLGVEQEAIDEIVDALNDAVQSGRISEEKLRRSYARVQKARKKLKLR